MQGLLHTRGRERLPPPSLRPAARSDPIFCFWNRDVSFDVAGGQVVVCPAEMQQVQIVALTKFSLDKNMSCALCLRRQTSHALNATAFLLRSQATAWMKNVEMIAKSRRLPQLCSSSAIIEAANNNDFAPFLVVLLEAEALDDVLRRFIRLQHPKNMFKDCAPCFLPL